MTLHPLRRTLSFVVLAGLLAAAPAFHRAAAQDSAALDPAASDLPIEIEANEGIEWRRDDKLYIARGDAFARRGDLEVRAALLTARYRDRAGGGSEIWQIEATGNVRLNEPGRTVFGDRAVYNLDDRVLTVTGGKLRIETDAETVTADESLEYRENEQMVIARGNAIAVRDDQRVRADVMIGYFEKQTDDKLELIRIAADGDVQVKSKDTVASGAAGDYDLRTEIMTLNGDVKITNGQNQFNGEVAEVNFDTGISKLLGSPSGTGRVKSLIMPSASGESKP
ncbi:MAG: LptA/OstA family protein [Dongiaceae bacterium]